MANPAAFNESIPSAGGTSIQSTCPERSAANRVFASGIGISTTLSTFADFAASQYWSHRAKSASCRGTILVMRNGPVPAAGNVATLAQSCPAFSNEAGDVNNRYTVIKGK